MEEAAPTKKSAIPGYLALGGLAVLAFVAMVSSGRWVIGGLYGIAPPGDPSWQLAAAGMQILGALAPILPQLALLFLFAWALRLVLPLVLPVASEWSHTAPEQGDPSESPPWASRRWSLALLGLGVAAALFVAVYAYLPAVNPKGILVGVDVRACYSHLLNSEPLNETNGSCLGSSVEYGNQRIGAMAMLRGLVYITGSNDTALKIAPAILAVLLVLTTYLLTLEGTGDWFIAGVSALFAAFSSQVIAGIDAGIIANWLGLSVAFLFFAIMLRGMRTQRLVYMVPGYGLLAALVFIHPWTWLLTVIVLLGCIVFALVQAGLNGDLRSKRFELLSLGTMGLGVLTGLLTGSLPLGRSTANSYQALASNLHLSNLSLAPVNLNLSLQQFLGGALADPLWLVLGAVGVLSIPSLQGRFEKVLLFWLVTASVAAVLLGPPPNTLQSRILNEIPVQIFAAVGIAAILNLAWRRLGSAGPERRGLASLMALLTLAAVVGLFSVYALDYVGLLYQG